MNLTELTAISPVDGRYRNKLKSLAPYFSEYALIRYRVMVEVEYFIALVEADIHQLLAFDKSNFNKLRAIYEQFSESDAQQVKQFEKEINHDVKAVEYFLKSVFDKNGWQAWREFIHFGLTSQDINNTAMPMAVKDFVETIYMPAVHNLVSTLHTMANEWSQVPMLARTHGQPASPTRLGKEIKVFAERIENQTELLKTIPFSAKFGGATGNFNAHVAAYPNLDWRKFANRFLEQLGLERQQHTTQIEHYDHLAALFHNMARINTILIDMARDIWTYISLEYFKQKVIKKEVGSSAMPHKVNPIDFENAEGNLGVANALFYHLAEKLPVSRLQRDLTDSTVTRNIGVPLAHTMLAFNSLEKGFAKLILNQEKINSDLESNWMVVAEGIQSILRREGYSNPYEALKELTRTNEQIGEKEIKSFISSLKVSAAIRAELLAITPTNYTGL